VATPRTGKVGASGLLNGARVCSLESAVKYGHLSKVPDWVLDL
jgi:hypothetical protein